MIVVGDVHGCHIELLELLDQVGFTTGDRLVSVGDLVDRGPESPEVVAWFRARPDAIVLMGNHERKHVNGVLSYAQEIVRVQLGDAYAGAVDWMRGLPYYLETPDVIVVHAALEPGVALADQKPEVLCGSTSGSKYLDEKLPGRYWHELYEGDKPVVFGHHVVGDEPLVVRDRVFGIDTGACHGGYLTAITIPDFRIHRVKARADHWKEMKRVWQGPVLWARPWGEMSWSDFDQELARHGRSEAAREHVGALTRWRTALDSLWQPVLARLTEDAEAIAASHGERFADLGKLHPQSALLFQRWRGRLDETDLRKRLYSPAKLIAVAKSLDLLTPETAAPREPAQGRSSRDMTRPFAS
jgi:serine/threonine protein phosphatase 1